MATIQTLGAIHFHPTPDDPFDDMTIESARELEEQDGAREAPPEFRLTLDEYAVEQFLASIAIVAPTLLNPTS